MYSLENAFLLSGEKFKACRWEICFSISQLLSSSAKLQAATRPPVNRLSRFEILQQLDPLSFSTVVTGITKE
jgi:hypothetical protein